MAYTYDDFLSAVNKAGLMNNFSSYDLDLARDNPNAGMGLLSAKIAYRDATDDAGRLAANANAENVRRQFGSYTGGRYGLEYNYLGNNSNTASGYNSAYGGDINQIKNDLLNRQDFSFADYQSPYGDQIADYLAKLTDRQPFSYDYQNDDVWSAYKKQYLREGDRASQAALAQAAALTGGVPSTAAVTAASQAGDYYATQLSDILPQLEENAYQRYLDAFNIDSSVLSQLQGLEDSAYNRYSTDRAVDYQAWLDAYNIDLSNLSALQALDDAAYNRFMSDLEYAASQDAANFEQEYNLAVLAADAGDFSYLKKLGIDTAALEKAAKKNGGLLSWR